LHKQEIAMLKSGKTPAEERFAATQRRFRQVQKEKDKARQEVSAQVAQLRAQRMAKAAGERDAAAADAGKPEKQDRSPGDGETEIRMPKPHRPQM
jgi:hypothetical protein